MARAEDIEQARAEITGSAQEAPDYIPRRRTGQENISEEDTLRGMLALAFEAVQRVTSRRGALAKNKKAGRRTAREVAKFEDWRGKYLRRRHLGDRAAIRAYLREMDPDWEKGTADEREAYRRSKVELWRRRLSRHRKKVGTSARR